jgi:hypothetical protein
MERNTHMPELLKGSPLKSVSASDIIESSRFGCCKIIACIRWDTTSGTPVAFSPDFLFQNKMQP